MIQGIIRFIFFAESATSAGYVCNETSSVSKDAAAIAWKKKVSVSSKFFPLSALCTNAFLGKIVKMECAAGR